MLNRRFIRIEAINTLYAAHIEKDIYLDNLLDSFIYNCKKEFYGLVSTTELNELLKQAESIFIQKKNIINEKNITGKKKEDQDRLLSIANQWLTKVPPIEKFIEEKENMQKTESDINKCIYVILYIINYWVVLLDTNLKKITESAEISIFKDFLKKEILDFTVKNGIFQTPNSFRKDIWDINTILIEEGLDFILFSSNFLSKFHKKKNAEKKIEWLAETLIWQVPPISDKIQKFFFLCPVFSNIVIKNIGNLLTSEKKNNIHNFTSDNLFCLNEVDKEFFCQLLSLYSTRDTINNKFIESKLINWTAERINYIDTIIIKLGICEIASINQIPKSVSINEYVEIAKLYSNENTAKFINSILDQVEP